MDSFLVVKFKKKNIFFLCPCSTSESDYDCPLCDFQGTDEEVTAHFLSHRNFVNVPLTCLVCQVQKPGKSEMDLHIITQEHQQNISRVAPILAPFMIMRGTEATMRAYLGAKGLPNNLPLEETVLLYVTIASPIHLPAHTASCC